MADLVPYERVHMVGAGGSGMSGLAKLLAQRGHQVTGSDLKPGAMLAALRGAGVETWVGHRPERSVQADLVVASSAVPEGDPELMAARRSGIPVWERPELLRAITGRLGTVGITGTHGKTTSTAMAVTALRASGRDPSFMVGGDLIALNTNAHLGEEDLFVLEADEAFGTFLALDLDALLVTNIEADHLDHYESVENLEDAFARVAAGVTGPVVGCADDPGVRRLMERHARLVTYGEAGDSAWVIRHEQPSPGGVAFSLEGPRSVEVTVPIPGSHVARNAAGVIVLLTELGFDPSVAAAGLAGFAGVRRRFEVKSRRAGITIIDDYAHHPTEVAATVAAARGAHHGRLVAAFQPHRYSRTMELGTQLGRALGGADLVVVTDVYAAGEAPIPGVTARRVAEAVPGGATIATRAELAQELSHLVAPGDLLLLLGAGDITQVAGELTPLLE